MLTSKVSATGPNVEEPADTENVKESADPKNVKESAETEKKEDWGTKAHYQKAFDETKSPWERVTKEQMVSKGTKNPAKVEIIGMKKCKLSGKVG